MHEVVLLLSKRSLCPSVRYIFRDCLCTCVSLASACPVRTGYNLGYHWDLMDQLYGIVLGLYVPPIWRCEAQVPAQVECYSVHRLRTRSCSSQYVHDFPSSMAVDFALNNMAGENGMEQP